MLIGKPSRASVEVQSIWNSVSDVICQIYDPTWKYVFDNTYRSIDTSIATI
jgi:hypothetical protein